MELRTTATGVEVYAGGERVALFTTETDSEAIARFVELCKPIEAELETMRQNYAKAMEANMASKGQDRNYHIFGAWDRAISKLCQRAGIIDS